MRQHLRVWVAAFMLLFVTTAYADDTGCSDPLLQSIALKAQQSFLHKPSSLSPAEVLEAFKKKLNDLIFNFEDAQAERRMQRTVEQASMNHYTMENCFPGLAVLMADARSRQVAPSPADTATATLFDAYRHYAFVKYCNEIRQGYASVYVNDIELDRARAKIKAIEASYVATNKDLDTTTLFGKAASSLKDMNVDA
jgi:hypothetical protein